MLDSRLFTVHQTALFVDEASGVLVHGANLSVPKNLRLRMRGETGHLAFESGSGEIIELGASAMGSEGASLGVGSQWPYPAQFEVVQVDTHWLGLRYCGFFLSAFPGGAVSVIAPEFKAWEHLLPANPRCSSGRDRGGLNSRKSISLSCVETRSPWKAMRALESTAACVDIDCIYWFSTYDLPEKTVSGISVINIRIDQFRDFFDSLNSVYLIHLAKVVETDFTIIVQEDGFAVNPQSWDDGFLDYDYIGAPWVWMYGNNGPFPPPIVGNGGFSLRSRKLLSALLALKPKWMLEEWAGDERVNMRGMSRLDIGAKAIPEDVLICRWYRRRLEEEFGVRFCPADLALKFSVEELCGYTQYWLGKSFGFHGFRAAPYYGIDLNLSEL
jgi:Protein of unknown function (DUF5672)